MVKSKEMFGKRIKDMTKYEFAQWQYSLESYRRIGEKGRLQTALKGRHRQTFAFEWFGKRYRDLNADEMKEYNRIKKAKERNKNERNNYSKSIKSI